MSNQEDRNRLVSFRAVQLDPNQVRKGLFGKWRIQVDGR
jgi:hypothetical protein